MLKNTYNTTCILGNGEKIRKSNEQDQQFTRKLTVSQIFLKN